jgi:hypothetical protein
MGSSARRRTSQACGHLAIAVLLVWCGAILMAVVGPMLADERPEPASGSMP